MNKTLVIAGTALLVLAAAVATVPSAAAYGVCAGVCAEAWQDEDGNFHQQTCIGNVVVQVGLDNDADLCSDD